MEKKGTQYLFRYPTALTIAGSDSCGGAGIQADLKTFSALGVYGMSAITAVTAQNTQGVRGIQPITPTILRGQIDAVFEDFQIDSVKIGMLYCMDVVKIVAELLAHYQPRWVILDPVMISTSGSKLLEDEAIEGIIRLLFPLIHLLTPNVPEAEYLTGITIRTPEDREDAANKLIQMGCRAVLIKGGHLEGEKKTDLFYASNGTSLRFTNETVRTHNLHGTGCTLSSAITALLAKGCSLPEAIQEAEKYVYLAISEGKDVVAGHGNGPINHFYRPQIMHKIKLDK